MILRKKHFIIKRRIYLRPETCFGFHVFSFNNKINKQTFGTPVGSPLFPVISDLVLQDLKTIALKRLALFLPFYYRYVDDIVLAAPRAELQKILDIFNSYHSRLKFTLEINDDNKICFLDTIIIKNNKNILEIDWHTNRLFRDGTWICILNIQSDKKEIPLMALSIEPFCYPTQNFMLKIYD